MVRVGQSPLWDQKMGREGVAQRVNTLLINSARLGSDTDFILFLIVKFR